MNFVKISFISLVLIMTAIVCFSAVDLCYYFIFSDTKIITAGKNNSYQENNVNKELKNESLSDPVEKFLEISNKNLFGTLISKIDSKPEIDISSLGKTALNLKLLGTVVGFEENYAVILSDNNQGLYKETDTIKDASIKRIFRQKVVLTRNGKDEILTIDPEKGQKQEYFDSIDSSINASGENQYQISREFIDQSLNNINSLMRQARARPHFENGNPGGIIIDNIKPFSLFNKMGLENGDVLVGANGTEIKTVNDAIGLYNGLKNSDRISLQVKRNGQDQTIEYNIE
ncbi:MAG: type II secretion system protein N [Desulforegulaceae bacterium]|nr:type II secretion system protein N [Desulforegulaceae bacterium]